MEIGDSIKESMREEESSDNENSFEEFHYDEHGKDIKHLAVKKKAEKKNIPVRPFQAPPKQVDCTGDILFEKKWRPLIPF